MTVFYVFLVLAITSLITAGVSAVLVTNELNKRGVKTPFLTFRMFFLKYLHTYREMTLAETGRVGVYFYTYIVGINSTWILALAAFFASKAGN